MCCLTINFQMEELEWINRMSVTRKEEEELEEEEEEEKEEEEAIYCRYLTVTRTCVQ